MLVTSRQLLISFVIATTIGFTSSQDASTGIDCYSWTGQVFPNNTQCSGSRICCATQDLCDPNRFCLQNGQLVVPACSVFPWTNCANICQYDPGTGYLPRAVECTDGSFCCDNDPTCCSQNRGIVLNGLGAIVSTDGGLTATTSSTTPTSSTTATTTMPSSTASTTASNIVTTTPTPTQSAQPSKSTDLSIGVKAGIGIGAAVGGAAVAILIVLLIIRLRRRSKIAARQQSEKQNFYFNGAPHNYVQGDAGYYNPGTDRKPVEMETTVSKNAYLHEMEASTKSR